MESAVYDELLQRSASHDLSIIELLGAADQLTKASATDRVVHLYRHCIAHNSDHPVIHAIYFNLGSLLGQSDAAAAVEALTHAVQIKPDFLPALINLGTAKERLGARGEAVNHWYDVVNRSSAVTSETIGYKNTALRQIARVLESNHIDHAAEEALRQSLELNPQQTDVCRHWLSIRMRQCKWPVVEPWQAVTRDHLLAGFSPLSLSAYTDDPLFNLGVAHQFYLDDTGRAPRVLTRQQKAWQALEKGERLKIGYISSDLRDHAVGYLMAEFFGLHDRTKIESFVYYNGHAEIGAVGARIKASVGHWRDIETVSDDQLAQMILDDGIQILVDLNGYTQGARQKALAMRPAPVIVNWLGYPGSCGSPYHDYILADDFIIPPAFEHYYSETIKRLPCYQPNDRRRDVAPVKSRAEFGLPEHGTVFCSFNGVQKITPESWARWMRILHGTPGSVLCLLEGTEQTNARLVELANGHGIESSRIIFAPRMLNADHLARYALVDLFLDSAPYGAHTTASDALWMGVPVLTLVGRGFASRVCGSLCSAAGLKDLVCQNADEFVALGIKLGNDRALLHHYQQVLRDGRESCVLFDIDALVRQIETLYAEMWDEFCSGKLKRPDLRNLPVYAEIGRQFSKEGVEMMLVPNLDQLYLQRLAEWHHTDYIHPDSRIWTQDQIDKL